MNQHDTEIDCEDYEPEDDDGPYGDDETYDRCAFPGECCMPGPHARSECYTAEMLESYEDESARYETCSDDLEEISDMLRQARDAPRPAPEDSPIVVGIGDAVCLLHWCSQEDGMWVEPGAWVIFGLHDKHDLLLAEYSNADIEKLIVLHGMTWRRFKFEHEP